MLVRTDLPLEQQLVQSIHAAHEAGIRFGDPHNIHSTVVCQVQNEEELLQEYSRLKFLGINSFLFSEPDIGNEATALCTELIPAKTRKHFARLKLWRS